MWCVYNSDGYVSFTGWEDDVIKFLFSMCNMKLDDLRYFGIHESNTLWSDVYGTLNFKKVENL